ncbi:MAG: hypothetical protein ABT04_04295 [Granulicella sp. SCN 62-9]|nr:MAG: hypothetical protein ABT04_04295 [Granulicella sp. SCN 62-9]
MSGERWSGRCERNTGVSPLRFAPVEMTYVSLFPFISAEMAYVSPLRLGLVEMMCFGAGLDGAGAVIRT